MLASVSRVLDICALIFNNHEKTESLLRYIALLFHGLLFRIMLHKFFITVEMSRF